MIYVECSPDKTLVRALGISRKEIEHAYNKGNVCNKLMKTRNSKGLVDEDPSSAQPSYINRLRLHAQEHDVKLLCEEKNQNFLIVLLPRLEEWILKVVKEMKIDISEYTLPDNPKDFHTAINMKLERFHRLIEDIKGSHALKTLGEFLRIEK